VRSARTYRNKEALPPPGWRDEEARSPLVAERLRAGEGERKRKGKRDSRAIAVRRAGSDKEDRRGRGRSAAVACRRLGLACSPATNYPTTTRRGSTRDPPGIHHETTHRCSPDCWPGCCIVPRSLGRPFALERALRARPFAESSGRILAPDGGWGIRWFARNSRDFC